MMSFTSTLDSLVGRIGHIDEIEEEVFTYLDAFTRSQHGQHFEFYPKNESRTTTREMVISSTKGSPGTERQKSSFAVDIFAEGRIDFDFYDWTWQAAEDNKWFQEREKQTARFDLGDPPSDVAARIVSAMLAMRLSALGIALEAYTAEILSMNAAPPIGPALEP